jgi:hypothetical protein
MKRFRNLAALFWVALIVCQAPIVMADSASLTPAEANTVVFLWDFSKFKRDFFLRGNDFLNEPELIGLSVEEQLHVDVLERLISTYDIDEPIYYWGNLSWDFWMAAQDIGISPYLMWPNINYTDPEFFEAGAFIEEVYIHELRQALDHTDEALLVDFYTSMLKHAGSHLLYFASQIVDDPFEYAAQMLTQEEVDAILAAAVFDPVFEINPGLNDAWYDPATAGQGFFITVYPETSTVFIGWFTYDTECPGQEAIAHLGDTCQRWLTAQGTYEGGWADLVVYNSSGGLFDSAQPTPEVESIGSIVLQFGGCKSGSVSYDLPEVGLSGIIPIQRLAPDNVAACEARVFIKD